jgi:hypothetical protein
MPPAANWRISKPLVARTSGHLRTTLFALQKKGRLIEISLRLFFEKNCITVRKNYPGLNSKQKRPGNKFGKTGCCCFSQFLLKRWNKFFVTSTAPVYNTFCSLIRKNP